MHCIIYDANGARPMLGVDDRLVTPATLKWVKVGLAAGLATIPTTIVLY